MAYILFKNITTEEVDKVISFLKSVSKESDYSANQTNVLGVCQITINNKYAYLNENMCCKDNPYISWVMRRKEYFTADAFINAVKEHIEEYNKYYKEINER